MSNDIKKHDPHKYIWLIDMGGEVAWCDSPDPSNDIDESDVFKYVLYSDHLEAIKQKEATIERLDEYIKGRIEMVECSIGVEIMAENGVKENQERSALAELIGVYDILHPSALPRS